MKSMSSKSNEQIKPLQIFVSGSGGVGKSHLIKTMFQSVSKTLLFHATNPEKPRVLLLAPTGVAAINIDGVIIHSALGIIPSNKFHPLADKTRCDLRNKLSEVKLIVIDEISMVSSKLFYQIHERLIEVFASQDDLDFGGISIIVCGDLYQLPPVMGKPVYVNQDNTMKEILTHQLWKKFVFIELTEIMRQDNKEFAGLLNRVRVGEVLEKDIEILNQRNVQNFDKDEYCHAIHIFAENIPAHSHNANMLESIDGVIISNRFS